MYSLIYIIYKKKKYYLKLKMYYFKLLKSIYKY